MKITSLDPRITRLDLPENHRPQTEAEQWETYEVFHQQARGEQHRHVGVVHAPDPEMAVLFAKEQYARRSRCVNLWVVRTADVYVTDYADADMFEPSFDKNYRESFGYKNTRTLVDKFKAEKGATDTPTNPTPPADAPRRAKISGGIIVGKKS
jgi:ring-1,2-phenylacetyl-CoA epoxidase subunit PaaB